MPSLPIVPSRARRAVLLAGLGCAALAGCSPYEGNGDVAPTQPLVDGEVCVDPGNPPSLLRARARSDQTLRELLASGKANPAAEAGKAAAAGDFRLVGVATMQAVSTMVYGAECRVPTGLPQESLRVLDFVDSPKHKLRDAAHRDFGIAYNQALMADKRYPYADICRPYHDGAGSARATAVSAYGFRNLGPMTTVGGLGAAVRRGSVMEVYRVLGRSDTDVNKSDIFGLTPLAWAIAYRQPQTAEVLLRAKASPAGAACRTIVDANAPLQIARNMKWRGMIRRMRRLVSDEQFAALADGAHPENASLEEFNTVLQDLRTRYEGKTPKEKAIRHNLAVTVNPDGKATKCEFTPEIAGSWFNEAICEKALQTLRWRPARTSFGTPISGEVVLNIWVRDKVK